MRFHVELIKPSHYDDDGYVIQWWKASVPSNSLASLYAIVLDAAERCVLGPEMWMTLSAADECNTVISAPAHRPPPGTRRGRRRRLPDRRAVEPVSARHGPGTRPPRPWSRGRHRRLPRQRLPVDAPAPARRSAGGVGSRHHPVRRRGGRPHRPVAARRPCRHAAADLQLHGRSAVARRRPDHLPAAGDAAALFAADRLVRFRPRLPVPMQLLHHHQRPGTQVALPQRRRRRAAAARPPRPGVYRFFITDDDFARNRNWEPILDRIIELREKEGLYLRFIIQVDALANKIPGFIEKCRRAGCLRVFIGLENINPDNLLHAKKRQNKVTDYRRMLQAWRDAGVITFCGYILGFPADTGRVDRARHPHHPARAAGRHPGILRPDAAAGIGGSQDPGCPGRLDGSGHEPLRH